MGFENYVDAKMSPVEGGQSSECKHVEDRADRVINEETKIMEVDLVLSKHAGGWGGGVFQGTLSDELSIAVKVFSLELEGAFKSFDIECEVLRNIRHRNLVKIISSCCNIDFKALILEFMPSGSLEKWLYSHNHFWDILHSNVLLDEDMVYHLGDFGIAKLLGEEDSKMQTMTLATIGYMASERSYSATRDCAFTILQLALECSEEIPEERIDMTEAVTELKKIKIKFLKESNRKRRAS
ncbi:hypothetical protein PTKIN_Ptkin14bG0117800 [Pterospermum kingtungense]